jgi:hypothetical protein
LYPTSKGTHLLLIDVWLLNMQWLILQAYSERVHDQQFLKLYTEMKGEWGNRNKKVLLPLEIIRSWVVTNIMSFVTAKIHLLILAIYKSGLHIIGIVAHSNYVTHYDSRLGFAYYNLTFPNQRSKSIRHMGTRCAVLWVEICEPSLIPSAP